MKKEDITKMAHEAAGFDGTTPLEKPVVLYAAMSKDFLDKFAELVAKHERNECGKVCDEIMQYYKTNTTMNTDQNLIGYLAAELCGVRIKGKNYG